MMEFLDLSVPATGSGKFIELHQAGALPKVQPLWAKYCRLRKHFTAVEEKRSSCNEFGWLLRFAKKCQQENMDCVKALRLLADSLEKSKASIEEQCETLYSQLGAIDPFLAQAAHSSLGARLPYGYVESSFAEGKSGVNVLKRNWVIKTNPGLTSSELCNHFDAEEIAVPWQWTEQFHEVDSWTAAYRDIILRNRIHKMISETRRQLRLP